MITPSGNDGRDRVPLSHSPADHPIGFIVIRRSPRRRRHSRSFP
jgi:hypothetical protein